MARKKTIKPEIANKESLFLANAIKETKIKSTRTKYQKIYDLIKENIIESKSIAYLTDKFGVSPSGYYEWAKPEKIKARKLKNQKLLNSVQLVREYHKQDPTISSRHMTSLILEDKGIFISNKDICLIRDELSIPWVRPKPKKGKPADQSAEEGFYNLPSFDNVCYWTTVRNKQFKNKEDRHYNPNGDGHYYWVNCKPWGGKLRRIKPWIKWVDGKKTFTPAPASARVMRGEILTGDAFQLTSNNDGALQIFFVMDYISQHIIDWVFFEDTDKTHACEKLIAKVVRDNNFIMMSTDNGDPDTKEPYKTTFIQKILKDKNVYQTFSDHRRHWQPAVQIAERFNAEINTRVQLYRYWKKHPDHEMIKEKTVLVINHWNRERPYQDDSNPVHRQFIADYLPLRDKVQYWFKDDKWKTLKDYCVIDVETTGLESEHEIVELGALRIRNNEVVAEFSQLVKPIKMPTPEVIDIHHITPEMLKDQPRFGEVYEKYRKFIGDDVVVGFVVDFDLGMLYREAKHCKAKPINNQSFDVKRISGKGGLSHHATQYNLGVQRHRALGDCELAWKLLRVLQNKLI